MNDKYLFFCGVKVAAGYRYSMGFCFIAEGYNLLSGLTLRSLINLFGFSPFIRAAQTYCYSNYGVDLNNSFVSKELLITKILSG